MEKMFRIIAKNDDCVLLERKNSSKYKVVDIENDTIYYGTNFDMAKKIFNEYDLASIRREKQELFDSWLAENAE